MATYSQNLNMILDSESDYYSIQKLNDNFQKIDDEAGAVQTALTTKANAADVYTKTEVDTAIENAEVDAYTKTESDALLAKKANADDVYTKTQSDTALALKANAADVYTKTQSDTALAAKANSADVYTKTQADTLLTAKANTSDVYTKTETDTKLAAKANTTDMNTALANKVDLTANPVQIGSGASATGTNSTAVGPNASAKGIYSAALGNGASAEARYSTALGSASATGEISTAVGSHSLASGSQALAAGAGAAAMALQSVAVGVGATVITVESDYMQLGGSAVSVLRSPKSLTVVSDERDKTDIEPIDHALDFIKAIEAIRYVCNFRDNYLLDDVDEATQELRRQYGLAGYDQEAHARGDKKGDRKRVGVSAQQVESVMQKLYDTDNYADIVTDNLHDCGNVPDGVESKKTVTYTALIPFLIAGMQELTGMVEQLQARVDALEAGTAK